MRTLIALLAVAALLAAGCSSGSGEAQDGPSPPEPQDTTPSQDTTAEEPAHLFTKAELREAVLKPADQPLGMGYVREESGVKELYFDAGIVGEEEEKEAKEHKLRLVFDTIFEHRNEDMRVAARYWLFGDAAGARYWFDRTSARSEQFGFQQLEPSGLGDASWAGGGDLGGTLVISHAIRVANVVVVVAQSTSTERPTEQEALTAAQLAVSRLVDEA